MPDPLADHIMCGMPRDVRTAHAARAISRTTHLGNGPIRPAIDNALRWMHVVAARRSAAIPRAGSTDPVDCFARAAANQTALEAQEELEIVKQILGSRSATGAAPVAPAEASAASVAPLQQLIVANLRVVASTVERFVRHHPELHADMLQEGVLGLYRALGRYDPRHGARFSTYAVWWVYQCVARMLARQELIVRLPAHVHDVLLRLRRTRAEFDLARPAAEKNAAVDLAHDLDCSRQTAAMLMALGEGAVSLNRERTTAPDGAWPILIDSRAVDPGQRAVEQSLRDAVSTCLAELEPRSRQVLEWRFGFSGEDELTLDEIGLRLGLTRESVRRVEARALDRLRIGHRRRMLEPFLPGSRSGTEGTAGDPTPSRHRTPGAGESPPELEASHRPVVNDASGPIEPARLGCAQRAPAVVSATLRGSGKHP